MTEPIAFETLRQRIAASGPSPIRDILSDLVAVLEGLIGQDKNLNEQTGLLHEAIKSLRGRIAALEHENESIELPDDLVARIEDAAAALGVTPDELIARALTEFVEKRDLEEGFRRGI